MQITKSVTCFSIESHDPRNTIVMLKKAYKYALLHKKPVHVCIDEDILTQNCPQTYEDISHFQETLKQVSLDTQIPESLDDYEVINRFLDTSKIPLIIIQDTNTDVDTFLKFIENLGIPFCTTMENLNFGIKSKYYL